ncbi:high-potential iron-sulfur protein [uncultured Muribaculum sp.]|uniref:high-potential iron-sulfur protein n=1 Tax=uncultured Muribaculum sp. TaxID=1918613 RepID=UPI0034A0AB34
MGNGMGRNLRPFRRRHTPIYQEPRRRSTRSTNNKHMSRKAPETCQTCIFYQATGDDIGTCTIFENIVEPLQEACNDQISNTK